MVGIGVRSARAVVIVIGVVLSAAGAYGGGFALYEGSAHGNATGGGMVARAGDASVLFYNPAGITRLPGTRITAGVTAIVPTARVATVFDGATTVEQTEPEIWTVPHLYVSYQGSPIVWYALGVFSRFGLGTAYSPDWAGRYNTVKGMIRTVSVNPNIAVKANEHLSLSMGLSWTWMDLCLTQKIDFSSIQAPDPDTYDADIDQALSGNGCAPGFTAAAHWRISNRLAFGISYWSKIRQHLTGRADFTKPVALQAVAPAVFNDTAVSGDVTLPDMLFVGLSVQPFAGCTLELGGIRTGWSSYQSLDIHYDVPILPGVSTTRRQARWHDVWRIHVGLAYRASEVLDLRFGYVWDPTPVPDATADYLVPANDRRLFCLGLGVHGKHWRLDLSYGYLRVKDRSVAARPAEGILDSTFEAGCAHLIGLSLSRDFW
ncbi:MAG: outer membrane protein transport protein [Deltaproteobacteria bacterium]|nr:outer membrane protein transport protein [Deltaproteobacteria bacterium]